jgi:hypothetical protein
MIFAESTANSRTGTHQTFENFKCVKYNDDFDAQLVPSDGSCFFAALAHQLYLPLQSKTTLRKELVEFIRTNEERMIRDLYLSRPMFGYYNQVSALFKLSYFAVHI